EPLWPFPNEAVIKADMASYSGPGGAGARGFTAGNSLDGSPQTLTRYIWEYLGNQIPAEIYGPQTGGGGGGGGGGCRVAARGDGAGSAALGVIVAGAFLALVRRRRRPRAGPRRPPLRSPLTPCSRRE